MWCEAFYSWKIVKKKGNRFDSKSLVYCTIHESLDFILFHFPHFLFYLILFFFSCFGSYTFVLHYIHTHNPYTGGYGEKNLLCFCCAFILFLCFYVPVLHISSRRNIPTSTYTYFAHNFLFNIFVGFYLICVFPSKSRRDCVYVGRNRLYLDFVIWISHTCFRDLVDVKRNKV